MKCDGGGCGGGCGGDDGDDDDDNDDDEDDDDADDDDKLTTGRIAECGDDDDTDLFYIQHILNITSKL